MRNKLIVLSLVAVLLLVFLDPLSGCSKTGIPFIPYLSCLVKHTFPRPLDYPSVYPSRIEYRFPK